MNITEDIYFYITHSLMNTNWSVR